MANNRLFLVHRPTGEAVFLGKRMCGGWYGVPDNVKERIEELFSRIANGSPGSQDDMVLAMEENDANSSMVCTRWKYVGSGGNPITYIDFK